ncbi:M4 family metallopeptidase [Nocardioides terrisoli]|uniref:M4 family metallopeptidase n=1 Tax=Nocardioides terrisoli TaxID=3388267 RepID=UPI00287B8247|nr:M4 family metallopeptidase [Nocardioides marmorisolisilvae]
MSRLALAAAAALAVPLFAVSPAHADGGPSSPRPPATAPATAAGAGSAGSGSTALSPTDTPPLTAGLRVRMRAPGATSAALSFLASHRDRYRIAHPHADLRRVGTSSSGGVKAVRFAQRYHGIPVLGAQYVVRVRASDARHVVEGTSGRYFGHLEPDLTATVSTRTAALVAQRAVSRTVRNVRVHDGGEVVLPFGRGLLARHVTVTGRRAGSGLPVREETFVAAGRSQPVLSYDAIDYDTPVDTTGHGFHGPALPLQATSTARGYVLRDTTRGHGIETYDANREDLTRFAGGGIPSGPRLVTSATIPFTANPYGAIDAQWGAERVYDFYKSLGRDGLDGKGGRIVSVVGVSDHGGAFPNAFWNGDEMVYGVGGDGYRPFSASLDVVGHEMTHGVVQHSAGLLGFGQSGALNEAVADYFGNAIENQTLGIKPSSPLDGLMGQSLCRDETPAACATRNLDKLHTTAQFDGSGDDNGGVHDNSTIMSGAFWQARRILGIAVANRDMYTLLTQYLTPLSDFLDARAGLLAVARSAGATSTQLGRLRDAFRVRGVVAGWEHSVAGMDSRALYPGMSSGGNVSVGGRHWVITDAGRLGDRRPSVYAGRTDHAGHRLISSNSHLVYDVPSTDGRHAAWSATATTAAGTTVRVQLRSLSGGRTHTLASYRHAMVWATGVDGLTTAWTLTTARGGYKLVVHRSGGRLHTVRASPQHMLGDFDVSGDTVYYTVLDFRPGGSGLLRAYDARRGSTRTLATVRPVSKQTVAGIYQPTVVGSAVYYVADRGRRSLRDAIVRMSRRTGHQQVLVPDTARYAPRFASLSASRKAVTYESFERPRLVQIPSTGGRRERVSCSRGAQTAFAAAGGRRVLWTDFSVGRMDLVTRARPAGRC